LGSTDIRDTYTTPGYNENSVANHGRLYGSKTAIFSYENWH